MIDKAALKPLIPKGDYCYTHTGRMVIDNRFFDSNGDLSECKPYFFPETKNCPFWKGLQNGDAFCSFLEITSTDDSANLLWDQVKECGENMEYQVDSSMDEPESKAALECYNATSRSNKNPEFITSLIQILSNSESNNFSYDGTNYTLSAHMLNHNS